MGGYWLPRDLHTWPEVRALTPQLTGLYFAYGVWSAAYEHPVMPEVVGLYGGNRSAAGRIVDSGLWEQRGRDYRPRTTQELRGGRRLPGQAIAVSNLLPQSLPGIRAGMAGLGLWAVAASCSLTTGLPGFIPRAAVRQLGHSALADTLCATELWLAGETGYWMTKGDHPLEERWSVIRDDERVPIPDELRLRIYERDGFCCQICPATEDLTLDHIYPWSLGGPDTEDNLRVLCRPCNCRKGARV
jgi:hypothetical protein